ncbi:glycosyltransferase family 2 protein [Clostridium hydrogenum]|uniref:glycosyltransferase family 2 protein n=1 Tax=Clostridium hydrogenum TaxID=2855764 RepID=UPI001F1FB05C|nr:glycosyltransferase family A protein [Clostridium hydrogenum]
MDSEITVVIPSYNPGRFLKKALQSLYEQTYPNWKLILIDDASTDNSLYMAKDLLRNRRIKVIKNYVNSGQSKVQNIALQAVTTPYFVQLDSDDWLMPYALEMLLREFKRQPENVAVVSGNILVVNRKDEEGLKYNNNRICKGDFFKNKYDFLLFNKSLWPRCYRTDAVRKIGGWPTDVPYGGRYMEDKLILYRLIEKYKFYWMDKVLYVHRNNEESYVGQKLQIYNYMIEWGVKDSLRRWGNEYKPVFSTSFGWKIVNSLISNSDGKVLTRAVM